MFLKQKLSKTTKNTIVENYGRLKGGPGARAPPKYATAKTATACGELRNKK